MPQPFPVKCGDFGGTGFVVSDGTAAWFVTCVHVISGLRDTPPDSSIFVGKIVEALTVPVSLPLYQNSTKRFRVVQDISDGLLLDVLAIRLSPSERTTLSDFGSYDRTTIEPPLVDQDVVAVGFPGVSTGNYTSSTLSTQIDQVVGVSIALAAPSAPGMSGGPLTRDGRLIGIVHGDRGTAPDFFSGLAMNLSVVGSQLFV